MLYGNIDILQVDLEFRVSGRLAEMRFEEVDRVRAGTIIAVQDKALCEDDLRTAVAQRDVEAANLDKLKHGNRSQEIDQARVLVAQREAAFMNAPCIHDR